MRSTPFALLFALVMAVAAPVLAASPDLPQEKQTKLGKYLTAKETAELLRSDRAKMLFVDTRTRAELAYVGMTHEIDGHVPYVELNEFWEWDDKNGRFKVELNQNFGADVEKLLAHKGLAKADRIVLMCRSGDRSARAANLLADLGHTNVWTVVDGFEGDLSPAGRRDVNGWKNAGLPWTYKLDKTKLYLPPR